MGTSTDAILAYGYDLGAEEDEWKVQEVGEYGGLNVGWWADEDEDGDFIEAAENRLLAANGFTETDWQVDGYFKRRDEALAALGVAIVSHCSREVPMYILAAHSTTAHRGSPKTIDPSSLVALQEGADARLARALEALGITPTQEAPAWLLASDWG